MISVLIPNLTNSYFQSPDSNKMLPAWFQVTKLWVKHCKPRNLNPEQYRCRSCNFTWEEKKLYSILSAASARKQSLCLGQYQISQILSLGLGSWEIERIGFILKFAQFMPLCRKAVYGN
jgi:hypothetical protein